MTNELTAERLREMVALTGTFPLSKDWLYSAVRHCQRNMDFDTDDGGNEPDRHCGTAIAELINATPQIIALIEREARMREALEGVEPYLDAIVCFASTMDEHQPNRIAANVRAALQPKETDDVDR